MTVSDIIKRVRRVFGDDDAVQILDTDIYNWINDAQKECVMQHENLFEASATIDIVEGTPTYTLPDNCFTVQGVYFAQGTTGNLMSYYALRYMSSKEMDTFIDGWQGADYGEGTPLVWTRATDNENGVTIFPTPDTTANGALKVSYSRYAVDIIDSTSSIDLPPYYHSFVEHFCMMKAYELDEDWASSDRKAQLVQSTLNYNQGRENWFGHDSYPSITPSYGDSD